MTWESREDQRGFDWPGSDAPYPCRPRRFLRCRYWNWPLTLVCVVAIVAALVLLVF